MIRIDRRALLGAIGAFSLLGLALAADAQPTDPLPSWNEGKAKGTLVEFVEAVTTHGGADFMPPGERIAVFDNDGTLWIEQPIYTQLAFALDRVKALTADHPEWRRASRSKQSWRTTSRRSPRRASGAWPNW